MSVKNTFWAEIFALEEGGSGLPPFSSKKNNKEYSKMLHSKKKTYVRKLRGVGLGLLCAQKSYLTFICCVKIVAVLNGLSHTSHVKWFSRSWSLTTWLRRLVSKNRWWRADNTITISSNSNQHYSWGAISGRTSLCIFLD